jgi:hypothetical protein
MGTLSAGIGRSLGLPKEPTSSGQRGRSSPSQTPGGIIPFRWAASSRNGGRHHSVVAGDIIPFWWAASPGISTHRIDELGYLPFSQPGGQLLFHLISKLYKNTSLLITTNLAFAGWPQVFGDAKMRPTVVVAAMRS